MKNYSKNSFLIIGIFSLLSILIPTDDVYGMPVDLTSWTAASYPAVSGFPAGNWVLAADSLSVTQVNNGQPTMFFGDFNAFNTDLVATMNVNAGDDDFIGFVIGFEPGDESNPNANYLLIDWKKGTQSANFGAPSSSPGGTALAGLAVSRVNGIPDADEFWQHANLAGTIVGSGLEELARGTTLGNVGWVTNTDYEFNFVFQPNSLQVFVNGNLEIEINGNFNDGRFAFYNFSQAGVTYSKITVDVVGCPEPGPESIPGTPGIVQTSRDVSYSTLSDGTLNKDFGSEESISFKIYTYVDSGAVNDVRLIIKSNGLDLDQNPVVSINTLELGKLSAARQFTTFEIIDKSFVNWKTGPNANDVGENTVKVSFPCTTENVVENIEFGEIRAEQIPLFFLPGIGGTELKNLDDTDGFNGLEWIDVLQYILDDDIEDLALNKKGTGPAKGKWNIFPGEMIRTVAGEDVYEPYLNFLKSKGYYSKITRGEYNEVISDSLAITDNPPSNERLIEFPYDFRLDNTIHAEKLEVMIDEIITKDDGWPQVILTAHSMGGLIAKKYSSFGDDDVAFLFSMGTPYYGAVIPYKSLQVGDNFGICNTRFIDICFLEEETMKELSENWPSVYQILITQDYIDWLSFGFDPDIPLPFKLEQFNARGNIGFIIDEELSLDEAYFEKKYSPVPNTKLMDQAISFHDMRGFGSIDNVYIAYGDFKDTIVQVKISGTKKSPTYEFVMGRGDGTVPRISGENLLDDFGNIERNSFTEVHDQIQNNPDVQAWLWEKITELNTDP